MTGKRKNQELTVTQMCLSDDRPINFLKTLPKGVSVERMSWVGIKDSTRLRLVIPEALKVCGLRIVSQFTDRIVARGVLKDMDEKKMVKTLKAVCKTYQISEDRLIIEDLVVVSGTHQATFKRVTKQIRNKEDRRRKTTVLGLVSPSGKPMVNANGSSRILSRLSAKKYACRFKQEVRNVVLCGEVK